MPHARKKSATTLDPRGVLVFDTRALGRQPGAAREETRTIPAPDPLSVELAGVPAGAEIPNQSASSKSTTPDSDSVGTSGSKRLRFLVVTPSGTILPSLMRGSAIAIDGNQ
jgi:hypothetical protein